MVGEFEGKNEWALILGASSGLGLATARKLASQGLNLCLLYRTRKSDLSTVEHEFDRIMRKHNIQLAHFNMDAVKQETRTHVLNEIEQQFSKNGKIKAMVHSIAKGNLKPMVSRDQKELQNDDFHLTLENMAISLYDWTKAVFSRDLFSPDARIISFTSEGNTKAWENYAAVSAAKAALEAITRNIALEFATYGIKANCIQAGITDTPSFRRIPGSETLKEYALLRSPSNRLTTPENIADVVYLLLRDEAKWINGVTIPVDGGAHLS